MSPSTPRLIERRISISTVLILAMALALLAGCGRNSLPDLPVPLPEKLPSMEDLPDFLQDLQLPDLSQIPGLPALEDLPGLQTPEGGVTYAGPTEQRIAVGQRLPGTEIELVAISGEEAEFHIDGMRSMRRVGDSLDYSGNWRGIEDVEYAARLRIYLVNADGVRVAGVHRLVIHNIAPSRGELSRAPERKVPFTANVSTGQMIPGTTYTYVGRDDRGAQLAGLPEGDYSYFKVGDSISWSGQLRGDLPASYHIRVLFYGDGSLQVGGTVDLALPE